MIPNTPSLVLVSPILEDPRYMPRRVGDHGGLWGSTHPLPQDHPKTTSHACITARTNFNNGSFPSIYWKTLSPVGKRIAKLAIESYIKVAILENWLRLHGSSKLRNEDGITGEGYDSRDTVQYIL